MPDLAEEGGAEAVVTPHEIIKRYVHNGQSNRSSYTPDEQATHIVDYLRANGYVIVPNNNRLQGIKASDDGPSLDWEGTDG